METRPLLFLCTASLVALSACDDPERRTLTTPPEAAFTMNPEQLRVDGLDRHPVPADPEELRAAIARHDPRRAEGVSVTVDVTVDPDGRVIAVHPVQRAANPQARIVLKRKDGTQRALPPRASDPTVAAAADAALRDVRFSPALRNGHPVAHTFRMTIHFEPQAREEV